MRGCLFQGSEYRPGASSSILAQMAQPIFTFEGFKRMKSPIPAELRPDQVVAVVDTREQLPLALHPLRVEVGTLATGDYSVLGLENVVAVERKSLSDLLGCIGGERERFEKEVQRLLAYPVRAIIIESTWGQIEAGNWKSKVTASAAIGSLLGWVAAGVPIIMAENHERAGRYVSRLLFTAARRRWRELRTLAAAVGTAETQVGEPVGAP